MTTILGRYRRRRARLGHMPISYSVESRGRMYRVCVTTYGRVLFVMLKHKYNEQALEPYKRRYREICRLVEREFDVKLHYDA